MGEKSPTHNDRLASSMVLKHLAVPSLETSILIYLLHDGTVESGYQCRLAEKAAPLRTTFEVSQSRPADDRHHIREAIA